MVKKQLLRVFTQPEDPVTAIIKRAQAVDMTVIIEEKFWCRTTLHDDFSVVYRGAHSFRIWNSLAVRGFRLFSMYQAGGFSVHEEKLRLTYVLSQRKVKWKIVGEENKPKRINLNSPVGFAFLCVLAANLIASLILAINLYHVHRKYVMNVVHKNWGYVGGGVKVTLNFFTFWTGKLVQFVKERTFKIILIPRAPRQ